jgi:hypothetical protein
VGRIELSYNDFNLMQYGVAGVQIYVYFERDEEVNVGAAQPFIILTVAKIDKNI